MDQRPVRKAGKRWHEDTSLAKVPVLVCAASGLFLGNTYHITDQRLLDALNGGFVAKALRMGKDFMPLTEVEAVSPNGKKTSLSRVYIRKSNIYFVAEKTAAGTDQNAVRREHLIRKKTPAGTEIHMAPYVLKGNVHIDIWEEFLDTIDRDLRFMPLTEARIVPALPGSVSTFDFVAINKDHIGYITESAG